jgi:hypothetical protein
MNKDWRITKGADSCHACGRSFTPEEDFYSVLFVEGEEPCRRDLCAACWQGRPGDALCVWQAKRPPAAPPPPRAHIPALLDLFLELHEAGQPGNAAFLYVVALLLVRKRKLKVEGEAEATLVLRRQAGDARYRVAVPAMTEEAIRETQERLIALLDGVQSVVPADAPPADPPAPDGGSL